VPSLAYSITMPKFGFSSTTPTILIMFGCDRPAMYCASVVLVVSGDRTQKLHAARAKEVLRTNDRRERAVYLHLGKKRGQSPPIDVDGGDLLHGDDLVAVPRGVDQALAVLSDLLVVLQMFELDRVGDLGVQATPDRFLLQPVQYQHHVVDLLLRELAPR